MKYLFATVIFVFGIVIGQSLLGSASAEFDHSQCQYPNRWSNPSDGCDNTDPAVPECVGYPTQKAEQDCIDKLTSGNKQITIIEVKKAPIKKIVERPVVKSTCN